MVPGGTRGLRVSACIDRAAHDLYANPTLENIDNHSRPTHAQPHRCPLGYIDTRTGWLPATP